MKRAQPSAQAAVIGVHILHMDRAPHTDAGAQIIVSTLPVSQAMDQKKFNYAACKALAGLPVLAQP